MNSTFPPPLRTFLLSVSEYITKEDLVHLKFICKDYISWGKHAEIDRIHTNCEFFDLLEKDGLVKVNDLSFLAKLLKDVKLDQQSERVDKYNKQIKDYPNVISHKKYGLRNKKSSFRGRETFLKKIYNILTSTKQRMVVVLGPPGFGKSEVVIHEGHKLYKKGFSIIFVCMRQRTTLDNLCSDILKTVDKDFKLNDNVVDQAQNFLVSLETPTVLILDNCEDIQDSSSERDFQKFIEYVGREATNVKLLLGTRTDITAYEFESQPEMIEPLDDENSANLLREHASTCTINSDAVEKLAKACHGVPLLIFLAAKHVENGYDADNLAEHLQDNPYNIWKSDKYLCYSIRIFLTSKNDDLKHGLVKLANYARCFTKEEVQELYFKDSCECSKMLSLLRENALVQCEDGRYSIHPLIQTFCRQELQHIECTEVGQQAKHAFSEHYINKVQSIHRQFQSKEFANALEAYECNKMNIEQARQNALNSECTATKLRCIDVFNNSVNILGKVLGPKQCHTVYQELLAVSQTLEDTKQIAQCNVSIGFRHLLDSNHLEFSKDAFEALKCAFKLFQHLHRRERKTEVYAHCLSKLGLCYWLNKEREKAKSLMSQAADLRHCLGDEIFVAAGFCDKATAAIADGDLLKALGNLKECYRIYKAELGNHPWLATVLTYMSQCNRDLNKLDDAIKNIKESLEIRINTLGDHQDTARSYVLLAKLWEMKGNLEQALESYQNALKIQKNVLEYHEETVATQEKCAVILRKLNREDEHEEMKNEAVRYQSEHARRMFVQRQISRESKVRSGSHLEAKTQERLSRTMGWIGAAVCCILVVMMAIILVNFKL